eukprot:Gb_26294 [translate_table: standard]
MAHGRSFVSVRHWAMEKITVGSRKGRRKPSRAVARGAKLKNPQALASEVQRSVVDPIVEQSQSRIGVEQRSKSTAVEQSRSDGRAGGGIKFYFFKWSLGFEGLGGMARVWDVKSLSELKSHM